MSHDTITLASGHTLHMPAGINIYVCAGIVHVDPSVWGPDALSFRPSRWLASDGTLIDPPVKGSFVPWSSGPRVCPGMKMAQVEFVSVFFAIVRSFTVEAALKTGENEGQARQRLANVLLDSQPRVTLQMNKPRDVLLRFVKR